MSLQFDASNWNPENLYPLLNESFLIIEITMDGDILDANERFLELFQYQIEEIHKSKCQSLMSESDSFFNAIRETVLQGKPWKGESSFVTKCGDLKWMESIYVPCQGSDEKRESILSLHLDRTDQRNAVKWKQLACRNELSELPNRRGLLTAMDLFICRADHHNTGFAVLFLDINQFKIVNDTYGHHIGDLLICEVGKRLSNIPFCNGSLFHLSGDEFIILLEDVAMLENAIRTIFTVFNNKFKFESYLLSVSVSIGVSLYPDHSSDAQQLIIMADRAMYDAKISEESQNRYSFIS